jgi:hypothetical protein
MERKDYHEKYPQGCELGMPICEYDGFYLTVIEGADVACVYPLEKNLNIIGRSDQCDIEVDDSWFAQIKSWF